MNFECFSTFDRADQIEVADQVQLFAMSANYSPRDHTSDYKRNERQEMLVAPPLDLSFKKATTMDGTYISFFLLQIHVAL